jgi:hypothetical protein
MFSIVFGSEVQIKYIVGMPTMHKTHGMAPFCHISGADPEADSLLI